MSKRRVFMAVAVFMLAPVISAAQTASALQQGERKFFFSGSGMAVEEFNTAEHQDLQSIRRFLNLEEIAGLKMPYLDVPGARNRKGSGRVIADYYFDFGALVPLVGISMGYVQDGNDNDLFAAEPKIGLKYFMNPTSFLYGLLEYQYLFEDAGDVDSLHDDGRFISGIGLGLTFSY